MKAAIVIVISLAACGNKDTAKAKPEPAPPGVAKAADPGKPAYSPDAANKQIAALAPCSSQYSCPPFEVLASFGAAAGPQLVAFVGDATKPEKQRDLVAVLIGKAKLPDAGTKLVEFGLAAKDVTNALDAMAAAGECGGDATFAALTAEYDKENHGDDVNHLVELGHGLKAFGAKAMAWATAAMPTAKDAPKYADVIADVATPADRDALAALVIATKDQMVKDRLAARAIELGATDPKLWDAIVAGLASTVSYDRDDAGNRLEDITDKLPPERKAKVLALIKKALATETDPLLRDGLEKSLKKLGG